MMPANGENSNSESDVEQPHLPPATLRAKKKPYVKRIDLIAFAVVAGGAIDSALKILPDYAAWFKPILMIFVVASLLSKKHYKWQVHAFVYSMFSLLSIVSLVDVKGMWAERKLEAALQLVK